MTLCIRGYVCPARPAWTICAGEGGIGVVGMCGYMCGYALTQRYLRGYMAYGCLYSGYRGCGSTG